MRSLDYLELHGCPTLSPAETQAIATAFPKLVSLAIIRASSSAAGCASRPGAPSPTKSDPRWELRSFTFRPLVALKSLKTLTVKDIYVDSAAARPPGLPADAVFSLGDLTHIKTLRLHGAASEVNLLYTLRHLKGITALDLALLPRAWTHSGRPVELQPLSLSRLVALQQLTLRAAQAGAVPPAALEAVLSIGSSAHRSTIRVLHIDLPPPPLALPAPAPPPGAAAAADAAVSAHGAAGLAPMALTCRSGMLDWLLSHGMSCSRLAALRLAGDAPGQLVTEQRLGEVLHELSAASRAATPAAPPGAAGAGAAAQPVPGAGAVLPRQLTSLHAEVSFLPNGAGGGRRGTLEAVYTLVMGSVTTDNPFLPLPTGAALDAHLRQMLPRIAARGPQGAAHVSLRLLPLCFLEHVELDVRLSNAMVQLPGTGSMALLDEPGRQGPQAAALRMLGTVVPGLRALTVRQEAVGQVGLGAIALNMTRLEALTLEHVHVAEGTPGVGGFVEVGVLSRLTRLRYLSIGRMTLGAGASGSASTQLQAACHAFDRLQPLTVLAPAELDQGCVDAIQRSLEQAGSRVVVRVGEQRNAA